MDTRYNSSVFSYSGTNEALSSSRINMEINEQNGSPANKTADPSWKELVYDYSQETTIHGVRYLFMSTPFITRRSESVNDDKHSNNNSNHSCWSPT